MANWKKVSDVDVLIKLREEINRIGIADYPSKTEYNKKYDNSKAMSSSGYIARFNKSWEELMESIGLEYDKKSVRIECGKKGKGIKRSGSGRKSYESIWEKMSDDEILDIVRYEYIEKENTTSTKYRLNRDKENSPSLAYLIKRFGKWSNVSKKIRRD